MVDWPVWAYALEKRNRLERWISGLPLRNRRKRTKIHFHRNTGHRPLLVQVSSALPKGVSGIAARTVSANADAAAAAATATNASTAHARRFAEGSAPVVDAETLNARPPGGHATERRRIRRSVYVLDCGFPPPQPNLKLRGDSLEIRGHRNRADQLPDAR